MSLYDPQSWCKIYPQSEKNACQTFENDCIIFEPIRIVKPAIEVIDVSDCDSNASTVIDASNLGRISDLESMEGSTPEKISQPIFNAEFVYFDDNRNVVNNSGFSDLSRQINENFFLNGERFRNESSDLLGQIKISKVESLSSQNDQINSGEEKINLTAGNSAGINFQIKEEILDFQEENFQRCLNAGNEPQKNLDFSDVLQKYFPFVDFQQIPVLVSDLNSSVKLEPLDLAKKPEDPEKIPEPLELSRKVPKLTKISRENLYKCLFCTFADPYKSALKYHLFLHIETELTCSICTEKFPERGELVNHILHQHSYCPASSRRCRICLEILSTRHELVLHLKTHKKDGIFNCPICCYVVRSFHYFIDHVEKHMNPELIFCDDCGRSFADDKNKLAKHWHRNHDTFGKKRVFQCRNCGQVYKRYWHFERHLFAAHGIKL